MTAAPRYIDYLPLDDLVPADWNAKLHHPDIGVSLDRFGSVESIAIDERTGRLVAGHGRLDEFRAKRDAGAEPPDGVIVDDGGVWRIPVQRGWASTDDDEARAYLVASNELTTAGGWNTEMLEEGLAELADREVSLEGLGLDRATRGRVTVREHERRGLDTDPADVGEPPRRCAPGDLWLLGPHSLICGDSTDPVVLARLLEGHPPPDQVWTDPPYGVAYVGKTVDALTIQNDDLDPETLHAFLTASLGLAVGAARPGATVFVAAPSGPLFDVFAGVLSDLGCRRHTLVWVKDRFVLGRADYHYRHEFIFYGFTPTPQDPAHTHVPLLYGWKPGAGHLAPTERTFDTVWEFARPSRSEAHPTMKPVPLVERAIANHTLPGNHVLDVFGGSGTTLIAADNLDRIAHLIELDPAYCDVILDRWERHGGTTPTKAT